jgi:pSer/pThr/pTyr-binding forkhead associated (FHA) protein
MQRDPQRDVQLGATDSAGRHSVSVPLESTVSLPLVPTQDDAARAAARTTNVSVTLPVGVAMLIVAHGPNAGARFLLDRDITTAGRHPDSDIFLDDITVSRQHAQFHRVPNGFTIVDSGSLNGVYVNRQRVHTTSLQNGDEVQIGKFRMTFHAT